MEFHQTKWVPALVYTTLKLTFFFLYFLFVFFTFVQKKRYTTKRRYPIKALIVNIIFLLKKCVMNTLDLVMVRVSTRVMIVSVSSRRVMSVSQM
jgi:hypothetical protein